jgi:hypothetical protein
MSYPADPPEGPTIPPVAPTPLDDPDVVEVPDPGISEDDEDEDEQDSEPST